MWKCKHKTWGQRKEGIFQTRRYMLSKPLLSITSGICSSAPKVGGPWVGLHASKSYNIKLSLTLLTKTTGFLASPPLRYLTTKMSMRRVQTMAFILLPLAPNDVLLRATGFMASNAPTSQRFLCQLPSRKDLSSASLSRGKLRPGGRSSARAADRGHYCYDTSPWSRASRSATARTYSRRSRGGTERMIPFCCASGASAVGESPSQHSNGNRLNASDSMGWSSRASIGQQAYQTAAAAAAAAVVPTGMDHGTSRRDEWEHTSRDANGNRSIAGDRGELMGSVVAGEKLADDRASAASVAEGVDSINSLTVEGRDNGWESVDTGGAPWTEFEDWLLQDTFSRYVIGSGKHVLWRRMVKEVPELVGRTPQEARQRWLRLTGRTGGGGGEDGVPGSPLIESFYLQPPVLEQWEEVTEGQNGMAGSFRSFRGNVFGQKGVADGTVITTAPVDASGRRIQDQYVSTQCGMVYELGEEGLRNDLVGKASSNMLKFAPATVLAVSAAIYAVTVLSHHVQVEVFVI